MKVDRAEQRRCWCGTLANPSAQDGVGGLFIEKLPTQSRTPRRLKAAPPGGLSFARGIKGRSRSNWSSLTHVSHKMGEKHAGFHPGLSQHVDAGHRLVGAAAS